jgi:hypothetical protein
MVKSSKKLSASCHCGSIRLTFDFEEPLSEIVRCNCSICSKSKGFGMICLPENNITVVEGFESITEYIFKTTEAPHFFCIICGTHTHHKSRNNPCNICVNVACIDDFNIADYKGVIKNFDGINHPRDY